MIGDVLPIGLLIALVCFIFWYYRKSARVARALAAKDLTRVAGWLALLCVALCFAPLRDLGEFAQYLRSMEQQYPDLIAAPQYATYQLLAWSASGLAYVICFWAVWQLSRRREWSSVMWGMTSLVAIGPALVVVRGLFIPWFLLGHIEVDQETVTGTALASISTVIWIVYLSKSKRVKVRYGAGTTQ